MKECSRTCLFYLLDFYVSLSYLPTPHCPSRMEGAPHTPETPEPPIPSAFKVGDTVHVYQGTAPDTPGKNTIAFIGTVVGFNAGEGKWLVCVLLRLVLPCIVLSCHLLSCCVISCHLLSCVCRSATALCLNVGTQIWWRNNLCPGYLPLSTLSCAC